MIFVNFVFKNDFLCILFNENEGIFYVNKYCIVSLKFLFFVIVVLI